MKWYSGLLNLCVIQMIGLHPTVPWLWLGRGKVPSSYCRSGVEIRTVPRGSTQEWCFVLTQVPRSLASHLSFSTFQSFLLMTYTFCPVFFFWLADKRKWNMFTTHSEPAVLLCSNAYAFSTISNCLWGCDVWNTYVSCPFLNCILNIQTHFFHCSSHPLNFPIFFCITLCHSYIQDIFSLLCGSFIALHIMP